MHRLVPVHDDRRTIGLDEPGRLRDFERTRIAAMAEERIAIVGEFRERVFQDQVPDAAGRMDRLAMRVAHARGSSRLRVHEPPER